MSRQLLERAHDLIVERHYDEARDILLQLQDRSSTARRWLENLNRVDEPEPQPQPTVDDDQPESVGGITLDDFESDTSIIDEDIAQDAELAPINSEPPPAPMMAAESASMPTEAEDVAAIDTPADSGLVVQTEPRPVPENVAIPVDESPMPAAPMDDDLLPIDEMADLIPTEDGPLDDGVSRWEYREVVLKTWHQHIDNIEYALEQGGEKITIEDAYTKLLNESGAQGWEVVREEVLPQQYVRLLMKRRR